MLESQLPHSPYSMPSAISQQAGQCLWLREWCVKIMGNRRLLAYHDTLPWVPSESGDVKATVAVLSFILTSAAKHNVDGESLSSELQQLGLPKGTRQEPICGRPTCTWVCGVVRAGGLRPVTSEQLLCPQNMLQACAAATRRSEAPCRST